MKKRNRRRNAGTQRLSTKKHYRPLIEDLEARRMLAGDLVLGPGNPSGSEGQVANLAFHLEGELEDVSEVNRITNNTIATAERIALGFDFGEFSAINVSGQLIEPNSTGFLQNKEIPPPNVQPAIPAIDDGSILVANRVNHQSGSPIQIQGIIGDQVNGRAVADADFYEFEEVEAGQTITAHLIAPIGTNAFGLSDSQVVLVLYDGNGAVLQTTDALDPFRGVGDTYMNYTVPTDGDYYIAVLPYTDASTFQHPASPFDATTVLPGSATADVNYTLTVGVDAVDVDYYAVDLNPGDILGLNTVGSANVISVYTPDQTFMVRSAQDLDLDYPAESPLPTGGAANIAYVASEAGTHYVAVEGYNWANYSLEARLFRPVIESAPAGTRQILYLDFDGAELRTDSLGGTDFASRTLSPMRDFMEGWGLSERQEDDLIDRIIEVVEKDFQDLQQYNSDAGIIIKNSRDDGELFGQPYVSRLVIGGTTTQANVNTIGVANSLDVGNFDLEEDGLVLLDSITAPNIPNAPDTTSADSFNTFPIAPGASKLDLVATGIGTIISHEAGHYFGAYHTDSFNDVDAITDAGGVGVESYLGVGDDRIWGTQDDIDVSFTPDQYDHSEGLFGIEDVPGMLSNVLISGKGIGVNDGGTTGGISISGTIFNDLNADGVVDTGENALEGVRVYVDLNGDEQFSIGEPASVSDSVGGYAINNITGLVGSLDVRVATTSGQQVVFPQTGSYSISVGSAIPTDATFGVSGTTGTVSGLDFSDAPSTYGIASHQLQSGISLGSSVTGETGVLGVDTGDDGITLSGIVAGGVATGTATANSGGFAPGILNGWMDFNQDGVFSSSERIVSDLRVDGSATFNFNVPADAASGTTWARFRYGYGRGISAASTGGVGEVEDYPVIVTGGVVTPPTGGGDNGGPTITAPNASADQFSVDSDSSDNTLNVLTNDDRGSDNSATINSVGQSAEGGTVEIAAGSQSITYTPAAGFVGTDSFTYTISNSAGSSTATATVTVNSSVVDGEDLIRFRLETTDTNGNPITNVASGGDFVLNVYTDDLRTGGAGVYSAYLDIEIDGDATTNGNVTFSDEYPAGQEPAAGVIVPGSVTTELDEFGAFAGFTSAIGDAERILFSVPMTAGADGTIVFNSNAADILPRHEILLLDIEQPIPEDRIDYGSVTLTVGDSTAQALTNPIERTDVNGDGTTSARDALILINSINRDGARSLVGSDVAAVSDGFFYDVSGDTNLSSLDVLMVVNAINQQSAAAAAGEPSTAAVDAAFDSATDDDDDDESSDWLI